MWPNKTCYYQQFGNWRCSISSCIFLLLSLYSTFATLRRSKFQPTAEISNGDRKNQIPLGRRRAEVIRRECVLKPFIPSAILYITKGYSTRL
jgi:hypothetical protein